MGLRAAPCRNTGQVSWCHNDVVEPLGATHLCAASGDREARVRVQKGKHSARVLLN